MWQEESTGTTLACQIIDFKIGVFYFQIELPQEGWIRRPKHKLQKRFSCSKRRKKNYQTLF